MRKRVFTVWIGAHEQDLAAVRGEDAVLVPYIRRIRKVAQRAGGDVQDKLVHPLRILQPGVGSDEQGFPIGGEVARLNPGGASRGDVARIAEDWNAVDLFSK